MRGVTLAWLTSMALLTAIDLHERQGFPVPGELLGASLVFAGLGLVAGPAGTVAGLAAWGFVVAQVIVLGGQGKLPALPGAASASGATAPATAQGAAA